MSEQDVAEYRKSLAIRVSGFDVPRPIKTFEDSSFSTQLMSAIAKQGYEKPTLVSAKHCQLFFLEEILLVPQKLIRVRLLLLYFP